MDNDKAKLLLENLIARIVVDSESGQGSLSGVLTPLEVSTLKKALAILSEPAVLTLQPEEEDGHSNEAQIGDNHVINPKDRSVLDNKSQIQLELNLDSLRFETPEEKNIKLCLDFGTAMSKAFASIINEDDIIKKMPLRLGRQASGGKSKTIYPVPSSLWIDKDGNIFLAEKAIALSLQADPSGERQRFDSLKKELILGLKESTPFQKLMEKAQNPTNVPFSNGDAIMLYLGYLTDLACTELQETHGCSRYVSRNFALPSWTPERRAWGEKILKKMLIKAQIIADTFHGKWEQGININSAKSVIDKINSLEKLPEYIVAKGITEPLAVGSSKLRQEEPSRGLVLVLDVGAGTSDFALFIVVEDPKRNLFNAFPIKGSNQSLHMAGDTLDNALFSSILKKAGITNMDSDYKYVVQDLRMRIRSLKEDLFRDDYIVATLINGDRLTIEKAEFINEDSVHHFSSKLAEKFNEVINTMKKGLAQHFGSGGVSIVLTGGGATLPMVKNLAKGTITLQGITIHKDEIPLVPEEFKGDSEIAYVYPQLAVAIGGTMPVIIDEKDELDDFDIPTGPPTLHRFPISGN